MVLLEDLEAERLGDVDSIVMQNPVVLLGEPLVEELKLVLAFFVDVLGGSDAVCKVGVREFVKGRG